MELTGGEAARGTEVLSKIVLAAQRSFWWSTAVKANMAGDRRK